MILWNQKSNKEFLEDFRYKIKEKYLLELIYLTH